MILEFSSRDTAGLRKKESVPARIVAHRLAKPARLLDFGCGQSVDVQYYRSLGFEAEPYDPFYRPIHLNLFEKSFDAVVCTYVINTMPPQPRLDAMHQITKLLRPAGQLFLSVRDCAEVERERAYNQRQGRLWTQEEDGWRTSRGTFQKGFGVHELLQLLQDQGFVQPLILRQTHGITAEAHWRGDKA